MNTKQDYTKGALGLFVTRNIGYNNYSYYYCSLTQQKYRIREEIKYSDFMKAISSKCGGKEIDLGKDTKK